MRAIVLAGGKSTRMGNNDNKCIMPLDDAGHTILGRILDQLKALSVWPVVVVGYQAERIMERYYAKASFVYDAEYETCRSLHGLWVASQVLELGADEKVVLASGSNLITDECLKGSLLDNYTNRELALMYPYPYHLAGIRNLRHYLRSRIIVESKPYSPPVPHSDDCVAYTQFAVVKASRLLRISECTYTPHWRTVNSGWMLSGCMALMIGAEDTLDVNTPHDFELAKEMFGYG